jgi:hypothetical protein
MEAYGGCEALRTAHSLDNLLTDGCEVMNFTRRPNFSPEQDSR